MQAGKVVGFTICTAEALEIKGTMPCPISSKSTIKTVFSLLTKYHSTLYIGMDEVLAHYACRFENFICTFTFSDNPLLTPQDYRQSQYIRAPKIWLELDH